MKDWNPRPKTLKEIFEAQNVDELKSLARIFEPKPPMRKAKLVEFLLGRMTVEEIRRLWVELDAVQQSAIAETLFSYEGIFDEEVFVAKYGKRPLWGRRFDRCSTMSKPGRHP